MTNNNNNNEYCIDVAFTDLIEYCTNEELNEIINNLHKDEVVSVLLCLPDDVKTRILDEHYI